MLVAAAPAYKVCGAPSEIIWGYLVVLLAAVRCAALGGVRGIAGRGEWRAGGMIDDCSRGVGRGRQCRALLRRGQHAAYEQGASAPRAGGPCSVCCTHYGEWSAQLVPCARASSQLSINMYEEWASEAWGEHACLSPPHAYYVVHLVTQKYDREYALLRHLNLPYCTDRSVYSLCYVCRLYVRSTRSDSNIEF